VELDDHLLRHENKEHIPCNICGKEFVTNRSVKCHVRRMHSTPKIPCDHCGKLYSREYMSKHMKAMHDRIEINQSKNRKAEEIRVELSDADSESGAMNNALYVEIDLSENETLD